MLHGREAQTSKSAVRKQLPFSLQHPVLWRLWWRKLGLVGLGIVLLMTLAAIFAP